MLCVLCIGAGTKYTLEQLQVLVSLDCRPRCYPLLLRRYRRDDLREIVCRIIWFEDLAHEQYCTCLVVVDSKEKWTIYGNTERGRRDGRRCEFDQRRGFSAFFIDFDEGFVLAEVARLQIGPNFWKFGYIKRGFPLETDHFVTSIRRVAV